MYAWFVKDRCAQFVMERLFQNPKCNLNEYWNMGPTGLYFRYVQTAAPIYGGPGALVCDTPFDTWLFPKTDKLAGQMQFDWRPFTISIAGSGKLDGHCWMGVHKVLSQKLKFNIPKLKEMNSGRIAT